jgi:hypothetical protein
MAKAYVLTGTLKDEQTITLDEALPLPTGRFRLTMEPLRPDSRNVADIRRRQRARGHQPRTHEEVDAYLLR